MDASKQKIVQYLNEARASEDALVRIAAIADLDDPARVLPLSAGVPPRETRKHAARVGERLRQLGEGSNPLMAFVGVWEDLLGQAWR